MLVQLIYGELLKLMGVVNGRENESPILRAL
jgi:hypothetical protein